jgi:SAM-dependent methyltransferase
LAEFTGERVIPGQVDVDLLNEHLARYTFAARLARGKRVLDAGCGAGYGSVELAHAALSVVGIDVSEEAIEFARANYRLPNLSFEEGSVTALPHDEGSFDLVVAFEVIEHLANWSEFLREARRVLAPTGQFIVSTPNKLYYTESRGPEGANPFHVHEFEFKEFGEALKEVFPHVSMFLENHVEGVSFQPYDRGNTVEVRVDAGEPAPDESHFFVAVCAHRPQLGNPTFVYIPRAANLLRERERHIALLERELATKNAWLDKALAEHEELMRKFAEVQEALEKSNRWAEALNQELAERRARVEQLQEELAEAQANAQRKIADLEADLSAKTQWARERDAAVTQQTAELVKAVDALHQTEKELEERTAWALRLDRESAELGRQLTLVRGSRWVKLGRKIGLGPDLPV